MNAIHFPEVNLKLAENQSEYQMVPCFVKTKNIQIKANPEIYPEHSHFTKEVAWSMTACFELSDEEISQIIVNRKLWFTQYVQGNAFQPVMLQIEKPKFNEL